MPLTILILSLCILSSGFAGNIYKKLSVNSDSLAASLTMPSLWFVMLAVFFGILSALTGEIPDITAVPISVLGGAGIATASFILIESMKKVSLSISLIIMNLNFIIPVILSAIFLKVPAAPLQLAGMLLSITVIVLLNVTPSAAAIGEKPKKTAILLPLVACIANGMVNFCITVNGNHGSPPMFFFAVMYGSGALGCLAAGFVVHRVRGGRGFPIAKPAFKAALPSIALLGLCNGVCFYTERLLAQGRMNPAALFTTVTCASIALSLVIGFLFQGDKLTKKSVISMVFCVIAILCQHSGIA
jgi:drug/metabolite transporter (DMT)-like permease